MPYIKKERREVLETDVYPENAGELNYCITKLIIQYMELKGEKYQHYNDVMGVLDCAGKELYRRKIAPYEDQKIKQNSDVY